MPAASSIESCLAPSQCGIAVAIPTSEADASRHLFDSHGRDFMPRVCQSVGSYLLEVEPFAAAAIPSYRRLGVRVRTSARLRDFVDLCHECRVVILFAHWSTREVEFEDGLIPAARVAAAIPPRFTGTLDLCVCQPPDLVLAIKAASPQVTVRYSSRHTRPGFWFAFYTHVFQALNQDALSYVAALTRVRALLTKESME
jgi:hypothetical protein